MMELVNQIIGGMLGISLGINIILFIFFIREVRHSNELQRKFFVFAEINREREEWLRTVKEVNENGTQRS